MALETLAAPLLGAGVFSAAPGGFPAALRALLGYLDVYFVNTQPVKGRATGRSPLQARDETLAKDL